MALIRQANAARASREAIVLDLGDLMRQGEAIQARAQAEADRIIAEARQERERLISDASVTGHQEGFERGLVQGRAEGHEAGRDSALNEYRERLSKLEAAWAHALTSFEQERDGMLLAARQDVLKLAVAMGELVTRRSIAVSGDTVVEQLKAVLDRIADSTKLSIRIHPDDRTTAERALPAILARFGASRQIEISDSPDVERGSVVASTEGGAEIDASIRTQLERIVNTLLPGTSSGAGL